MHGNKFWKCWTPKAIYPSNITLPLWPTWRLYRIGLFFFFFFFAYLAGWMCMHFCLPRWARFLIPDTAQNRFEFNAQMYDFRDSFNTRTHTHTHTRTRWIASAWFGRFSFVPFVFSFGISSIVFLSCFAFPFQLAHIDIFLCFRAFKRWPSRD